MKQVKLICPKEPEPTLLVSLGEEECRALVHHELTYDGKLLDCHRLRAGERQIIVSVYERCYFRVGNALTATVTIDDLEGATRVHWVCGGGSDSALVSFDWGAADYFGTQIRKVLQEYELKKTKEG